MAKRPVLIELDEEATPPSVADAPPVPDPDATTLPAGAAMQATLRIAARPPSRLARWFWGLLLTLMTAALSAAAWDFVTSWTLRQPVLGAVFGSLIAALIFVAAIIAVRELWALRRLTRLDGLRYNTLRALESSDMTQARTVAQQLTRLYAGRAEMKWAHDRFQDLSADQLDAKGLLLLAERELMVPLDATAKKEIEGASRQVATVTALVPIALADVFAALTANLRMIRRIAEIYGGRAGTLGGWRLTRAVMAHLVATGAVAVGDDLLEHVLGGSVLAKLSRRFGEGLVNGALTARVGVAAMDVCRPLPFTAIERPRTRDIVRNALTGLVGQRKET